VAPHAVAATGAADTLRAAAAAATSGAEAALGQVRTSGRGRGHVRVHGRPLYATAVTSALTPQRAPRRSNRGSSVAASARSHARASTRSHPWAPSVAPARLRNFASTSASVSGLPWCPFGWRVSLTRDRPSVVRTSILVHASAG